MYLLSLRLPPSPWVGTRFSATAQYTVPSASTQPVTPRRVGLFACSCAPPRAEPAGPSVWCTMILRQGGAFATSPQGTSQTLFTPRVSGVPAARAMGGMGILAVRAGGVKGGVGGGDQPVGKRAGLFGPLRDADRDFDRNIRAHAGLGVGAAHIHDAAGDHGALAQR